MKCFIATAIGYEDVDEVYDKCVRPVLRDFRVTPLRVDRLEHNEEINTKIIALLDDADFAIADLTYARPSVYYEAGYAAGMDKPVIYIVRRDHLSEKANDPSGLLRVHFDLKMKNTIAWAAPDDAFSTRLARRLRFVLTPLLRMRKEEEELQRWRAEFGQLSEDARLESLRNEAVALLRARGFSFKFRPLSSRSGHPRKADGSKIRESGTTRVQVLCAPSGDRTLLEGVRNNVTMGAYCRTYESEPLLQLHCIVASLRPVPRDRASRVLSEFRSVGKDTFRLQTVDTPLTALFVHIIGGVKSQPEFADVVRALSRDFSL